VLAADGGAVQGLGEVVEAANVLVAVAVAASVVIVVVVVAVVVVQPRASWRQHQALFSSGHSPGLFPGPGRQSKRPLFVDVVPCVVVSLSSVVVVGVAVFVRVAVCVDVRAATVAVVEETSGLSVVVVVERGVLGLVVAVFGCALGGGSRLPSTQPRRSCWQHQLRLLVDQSRVDFASRARQSKGNEVIVVVVSQPRPTWSQHHAFLLRLQL